MKCEAIIKKLEELAPTQYAEQWDNVGLLVGSKKKQVKKILIALDATDSVIEQAVHLGADMLITHHPMIFSGMKRINDEDFIGRRVISLIQNDISYYAMHTNFDTALNGMNDHLAEILELENVYSVPEVPTSESYMRIGEIEKTTLAEFAYYVKETFNEEGMRVVGDLDKPVKKVAILGGSGGSFAVAAKKLGCDCIITGEVKQNNAIDALEYNMGIIEVSHSVEAFFKEYIKNILTDEFNEVEFILSEKDVNPFKCL